MMVSDESMENKGGGQARRRAVMAVLAHSATADIEGRLGMVALPAHEDLREPENGLVMVHGRVGGDGAPFNLGEATVSRAAVRLSTGEVGFGYTLGRDREKARLIALCDAMVQSAELAGAIETQVVAPLRAAMIEKRNRKVAEAAATRVDFYTLVRGEG
jgi:alpha-D-ribose 1-methylphosphonate 5-triphosphate synthase subunit PhnG